MASEIENNSDAWSTTFSIMSSLSPSAFIENRKDMLAITLDTIQKNHHRLKSELVATFVQSVGAWLAFQISLIA
jgi:hypothetical protein